MIFFHADLDNTLIYSYKHSIGPKRCVEIYREREISFMTEYSWGLLRQAAARLAVIPTTTRTLEQYRRVRLGIGEPGLALVANGGILLVKGERDEAWYRESLARIANCWGELERARKLMERDANRSFELRNIENLFLFTKSDQPEESVRILCQEIDRTKVQIFRNGVKVYAVPRALDKGTAVERLRARCQPELVLAAGDSEFDLPMLAAADLALAPESLDTSGLPRKRVIHIPEKRIFSDGLLEEVLKQYTRRAKKRLEK